MPKKTGRRSKWALFGAAFGVVGDVILQTAPDILAGAGVGVLRTVSEGRLDPASLGTGAIVGAAGGALARWGLDRARSANNHADPPKDESQSR